MTEYRVQKTIDVVVSNYDAWEGENDRLAVGPILGSGSTMAVRSVSDLRELGFDIVKITTPEEDPAGTVRRFVDSGDRMIKDIRGDWHYLTGGAGRVTGTEFDMYESRVV